VTLLMRKSLTKTRRLKTEKEGTTGIEHDPAAIVEIPQASVYHEDVRAVVTSV
jgi:hypothetical protein